MGKALFPCHTQGESAVGWGAGGSSTGLGPQVSRYHRQPLPSLALDTHLAGSRSRAGLGGGGRGRHWAFVSCSPRGPAQKPVPTLAPGCTLPSWERKEFRLESGVRPVPWLRGFLGKFPGASPSWLSAWFPHLQNEV